MAQQKKPYPNSDHFDGKKFFNPSGGAIDKSLADIWRWQRTSRKTEWPHQVENTVKPNIPTSVPRGEIHITFVNHATHLVQMNGLTLITDPVFSERVSFVQWAGPKRVRPPGLALSDLPKLDIVLISHNHYDHLDLASLKAINKRFEPLFITPLGNRALLESVGIKNIVELDWWESHALGADNKITVVPAQHWSARGLFDRNLALWGGFVVAIDGLKFYFAGDTGYGPHFKDIAQRMGVFDVSVLPIGAYEPRWFMQAQHMNPEDAVMAHLDLGSTLSIGTHYGTFQLTDEGIDAPILELKRSLAAKGIPEADFLAPENGTTVVYRRK